MEDFMDNLVKEVEDGIAPKPIRTVKLDDVDNEEMETTDPVQIRRPVFRKIDRAGNEQPAEKPVERPVEQPVERVPAQTLLDIAETPIAGKPADDKELFRHVHRENVKCYRNTQAVIVENSSKIEQGLNRNRLNVRIWMVILFLISFLNLGATVLIILRLFFGII